jgi:hypothetical protein
MKPPSRYKPASIVSSKGSRSALFHRFRPRSKVSKYATDTSRRPAKALLRPLRPGEAKPTTSLTKFMLPVPPQANVTRKLIRRFKDSWSLTKAGSNFRPTVYKLDVTLEDLKLAASKTLPRIIDQKVLMQQCMLVSHGNVVWLDSNGMILMQYLPKFIPDGLATELERELDHLVHAEPPTLSNNLSRYKGFQTWRAANMGPNVPCGELRFCLYNQQGHKGDRPGPSADLAGQCYRTEAALEFRTSNAMTSLTERLSRALGAIDHDIWQLARGQIVAAKKEWATFAASDIGVDTCFTGIFVLTNIFTLNHLDSKDLLDGLAAMAVLGHFSNAPLYVPQLKAKVPHQRQDVLFLRSRILQHFSDGFKILSGVGRYVLVFTNHQLVFDYLASKYELVYSTS